MSHPARGAWIEIAATINSLRQALSHPARGAWIEILKRHIFMDGEKSRTPLGVRG